MYYNVDKTRYTRSHQHSRGEEGGGGMSECLQLAYHKTVRDQLLLLYPREILILDLAINQTVGIIALDRTTSPFLQVGCDVLLLDYIITYLIYKNNE